MNYIAGVNETQICFPGEPFTVRAIRVIPTTSFREESQTSVDANDGERFAALQATPRDPTVAAQDVHRLKTVDTCELTDEGDTPVFRILGCYNAVSLSPKS